MEKVSGVVHRVTYKNDSNGYAILKIVPSRDSEKKLFDIESDPNQTITVTGNIAMLKKGEEVDFLGEWKNHPKYGTFLDVKQFHVDTPTSIEGLKRFLATDYFKGIGDKTAQTLIEKFGEKLPETIENSPTKLASIKGITKEKAQNIHESWMKAKNIRDEMIALQGIGLSTSTAQKVITAYPGEGVKKIRENPYQLAQDIWGVGFVKADEIARTMGFEVTHPFRIRAGIRFTLYKAIDNGHMYLPYSELVDSAMKILGVNKPQIETQLKEMIDSEELISTPMSNYKAIYLAKYYEVEKELARRLSELSTGETEIASPDADVPKDVSSVIAKQSRSDLLWRSNDNRDYRVENLRFPPRNDGQSGDKESAPSSRATTWRGDLDLSKDLEEIEKERGFSLDPKQGEAVKMVFNNKVSVLTGGPGTGKSTTIDTIVRIAQKHSLSVALTAPTGRAAKRMEEVSSYPAYTIHRLLRLQPGEIAAYNEDNPLLYDVIIVDEASMLDSFLALHLLKAIKPGAHLLLVGDADQLPSVQAGNVLHDIIESGRFPVISLDVIFRQAKESAIIQNAHKIKNGVFPQLLPHPTDFYLFEIEDLEDVANEIVSLVTDRLPKQFKLDAKKDIQVMAPLYKTKSGVTELNKLIQAQLNPKSHKKNEVKYGFTVFREGDRVMQLRNNYEKDVYNGDVGIIVGIESGDNIRLLVEFPDKPAPKEYKDDQVRELTLAYAVSVHKSQGSEYPAVVMPITTSHYIMLQRNLLYTAVTRAKKLVVLVGSKRAIHIALNNDKPQKRYSGLARQIAEYN